MEDPEMPEETKYFAIRKFLEGLLFSALVFVCFLYFLTWHAYFALGVIVAIVLAIREFRKEPTVAYALVATANTVLWPAMVYINATRE